ncbi:TM0106 family RecB-like putative nuclease [Rarobacter incanus]|uniref:AAA+ ATPase domain-containing protein n=1 Tax=Rarobacter incanus TaxID=153494 RepID=A0A542SQI9_9MICO|nr:bifunctional RecB family nuclease/DEAD/DEAH box helicase [Rarobacter incanus]TQK76886.1 uncharacterized protein FB389_1586 [Rarobacter incanus]
MYFSQGQVVTSPSDLTVAAHCEFAFARKLDALLGRVQRPPRVEDPMAARAAHLGDRHEAAVLQRYRDRGLRVVEIARPDLRDPGQMEVARQATVTALRSGADVVFQAAFMHAGMVGFADFLVRTDDGAYEVQDTKLARTAKVTALMQLASYAEQMRSIGITPAPTTRLILGDGSESVHALRDIEPTYRARVERLRSIVDARVGDSKAVVWGARGLHACGTCEWCSPEVELHDDVLQVAGMRAAQRARLLDAGVRTVADLAGRRADVPGIGSGTLEAMRQQAKLQLAARAGADTGGHEPPVQVVDPRAIAALPRPNVGDLFFDFEGDPMYSEPATTRGQTAWGLDYLFGVVNRRGAFTALWAHSLEQEKSALVAFLDLVERRRAAYPDMHIYHYAAYEQTHLLSIAARHGVGEDRVDALLRDGVLVDLYPVVRRFVRIGAGSYSLKAIEALYLPAHMRDNDVKTATGSVEAYWDYCDARDRGDHEEARAILESIAYYNEVDCDSTRRLHEWLVRRGEQAGVRPGDGSDTVSAEEQEALRPAESALAASLREKAGDPLNPHRSARQTLWGLAGAAVDYHRRETKTFWRAHFERRRAPLSDWAHTRDVLVCDATGGDAGPWEPPAGNKRLASRLIELRGEFGDGTTLREGSQVFLMYEFGSRAQGGSERPDMRPAHSRALVTAIDVPRGWVQVEEKADLGEEYSDLPVALTPGPPIRPGSIPGAISRWAERVDRAHPGVPRDPVVDIMLRAPSRTHCGTLVRPTSGSDLAAAISASVADLDHSYVAVQGPPGTGKTYTGARVIADLVGRRKWRIGVVAQSHAAVENVLAAVVEAGVDRDNVGKKAALGAAAGETRAWTTLRNDRILDFVQRRGIVVGGTAWDFSNASRIPAGQLDLLVIDEAGQFSLAATAAVAGSARNLLLLGDPQQLPQVSQGLHPEPVNESALGYLSAGHDVLPSQFGYFLPATWRMHSELSSVVSDLSYGGELVSAAAADARSLRAPGVLAKAVRRTRDGIDCAAGVHPVPVSHTGRATSSPEEAARVAAIIAELLGKPWRDPRAKHATDAAGSTRPLAAGDFIVVTPFNAQVAQLQLALHGAGLDEVPVGTVDKFQGRQAVISILSMAASEPSEVPRGMGFLLSRNRLNVAISRAQWASYIVYSPELVNYLPTSAEGVAELSAFLRVVDG